MMYQRILFSTTLLFSKTSFGFSFAATNSKLARFSFVTTSSIVSPFQQPKAVMSSTTTSTTTTTSRLGAVKVGDVIPSDVTLMEGQANYEKPVPVKLYDLIKGKKVAIFAVPGAFTPGCSKSHLPSFITAMSDLKQKGVEMVICVATNDAYVMEAWGRTSGGADAGIRFLSDGNAELTRAFGLAMDSDVFVRSKRYSLIADDGVITHYFSADEQSSDTWAPNVLAAL